MPPPWRGYDVRAVQPGDVGELLALQLACWVQEGHDNPGVRIPALHESLADVLEWTGRGVVLVAHAGGRLVGAARGRLAGSAWHMGRVMVAPDHRGRGLGRRLLALVEDAAPEASPATSCSPAPPAPATSGSTARPVTASPASSRPASSG